MSLNRRKKLFIFKSSVIIIIEILCLISFGYVFRNHDGRECKDIIVRACDNYYNCKSTCDKYGNNCYCKKDNSKIELNILVVLLGVICILATGIGIMLLTLMLFLRNNVVYINP